MVFCDHCLKNVPGERFDCYICCGGCGKLLEECSLSEESHYVKKAPRKELFAKEKITMKAFEAFVRNCSNDLLAARDELAQSAAESLTKSRKEGQENLKKVQFEPPSENHNNLESKSKDETEDELGSVDRGCDDYDELDSDDEFTDSDIDEEYENILYQENAYNKTYYSEDDGDDEKLY